MRIKVSPKKPKTRFSLNFLSKNQGNITRSFHGYILSLFAFDIFLLFLPFSSILHSFHSKYNSKVFVILIQLLLIERGLNSRLQRSFFSVHASLLLLLILPAMSSTFLFAPSLQISIVDFSRKRYFVDVLPCPVLSCLYPKLIGNTYFSAGVANWKTTTPFRPRCLTSV